ncbi:Methylthioribulose-1-phosphate dehydratase [Zhongshania aliphaticivorans]|uniref:Methylthioribulose-1-phosphate dehydratase n=2 Tax=Zhongshania aliphaticivorans TaxID=1470434 RepID=A0A5S9NMI5_9GAMM|nr:Methylthioribulose-1-phosphate dehydratase [Zhongshania aliphaticivorans]CAA0098786.1 Methylthioribulose-1-phosphate dehydratase [Zhongshania aliphaticivorans]
MIDSKYFYQQAIALAAAGEELYQRGWVPATSGNFSTRLDASSAIVTASGKHKGRLSPTDFIAVDLNAQPISEGKPSAETELHTRLYQRFPNIGAVLHCHSPVVTIISKLVKPRDAITLSDYELLKAFDGIDTHNSQVDIPLFDNNQDISALAKQVDNYFSKHASCPAYLIRGHGVYCWGDDLDSCMRNLEAVDFLLRCELELMRFSHGDQQ